MATDLAARLISAQDAERKGIGRELHDHISQLLGVLILKLDLLRIDQAVSPQAALTLAELSEDAAQIAADVHRLSHRLHSSTLDHLGLVAALQTLVNELSARHRIVIEFVHVAVPAPLPPGVALAFYRVAEESLKNIREHSCAGWARVELHGAPDGIHLTIRDNGVGFDVHDRSRGGLGIVSMQERFRVLHGAVRLDSSASLGTTVFAWAPAESLTDPPSA